MTQARTRDDVIQQDTDDLHKLGYAQELLRSMGGFSNFAISFSIISILTGAVILYNYGLALGGPAADGIGWPLVTIFTLLIAASMAELASAYPTAGGLYYWASRLRNKDWGWWTAWLNLGGQISIVAGINYAAAYYLGVTILGPLFGFDPNGETLFLLNAIWLTGLLMLIEIVFNVAGTRIVATMNDISVWWHIGFVVAIAVFLFALGSQPTHPVDFLFQIAPAGTTADGAPIASIIPFGIAGAFALSLLQAQWTYTGYDASAHVAEETVAARTASAWGVFLSVAVSAVAGYVVLVALTLKMTTPEDVLANSPGGYGVGVHPRGQLGLRPQPARWPARRRHRRGDDVLRLLVDRLRRPDAVRVQPRRRGPRQWLAQARQPALPHAGQQRHRHHRGQLAAHRPDLRADQGAGWRPILHHRRRHRCEHRPVVLGIRRVHRTRCHGRPVMA